MNVDFEFGEKKHIKLRICSCKGTDFLIERASYELLYKGTQPLLLNMLKVHAYTSCFATFFPLDATIKQKEE